MTLGVDFISCQVIKEAYMGPEIMVIRGEEPELKQS